MFYIDKVCGKRVVRSDLLKGVEHFFTTREFCLFSKTEDMAGNRIELFEYLGQIPATNQPVHGIHIAKIEESKKFYEETDGLLIEGQGSAYMNFGDCVPLIFYYKGVGIISHAGWRGTAQKMAQVSVLRLVQDYGAAPEDIKAVIGPAICMNCYEVGKDVYDALVLSVKDFGQGGIIKNGKYFVDLKEINKRQLKECGVCQIDVCPYCTACGERLFFSYRYENHTGYRHSAVLKI